MSVAEWFSKFCSELRIQDAQASTISSRYKSITQRLNTDFWNTTSDTAHSLYVGSYGRSTATRGFSDLDVLTELPNALYHQYDKHAGNGQSALLQAVRATMRKTYPTSEIGADGQVVSVSFTDGLTFEVVPAFINKDGESYTYPDANNGGTWKITNPRAEIEAIRTRNNGCNGNLIELCRMVRAWKKTWTVPIGGLLIDTLAYQFIERYEYRDKSYLYYDWMVRDFFKCIADTSETQEWWRAPGSGAYVWGKGLFQYKARRCYNIALSAISHQAASESWAAKRDWREIFGTSFPE